MAITIPTPNQEVFWDRDALVAEEKRVFEICNGCRLCFNLCPSFPALFDAVDALDVDEVDYMATGGGEGSPAVDEHGNHEFDAHHVAEARGDIMGQAEALENIGLEVHQLVTDLCWQCKLCDPICPYTPPHEFAVDFPALMLRRKTQNARRDGVAIQDKVLGDPDLVGKLGTMVPSVANWANSVGANRVLIEKTIGIHRSRQLPNFASQTFRSWFQQRHPTSPDPSTVEGRKVVLFYTCSVQWNEPGVGHAAVEVLEHNDVTVFAPEFGCCGIAALDSGNIEAAKEKARRNLAVLQPYVEAGCEIVVPGPSCSLMLKREYPHFLELDGAQAVSDVTFDLMEYIWRMRKDKALKDDFKGQVGQVNYHVPCHLKLQKIGFRSRDVMKKLPGAKVKLVDKCSCMDGTWGMKTQYYELSKKWAQPLLEQLDAGAPRVVASDCLIAKLQIEEGTGKTCQHPIEILWNAYTGDGLPPVAPPEENA